MQTQQNPADYLFVYGTLRRCFIAVNPIAQQLHAHADFHGMAYFQGQLFEIAGYPGVIDACQPQALVRGEIYQFKPNSRLLALLDAYEECSPDFPAPHEYQRLLRTVQLASGEEIAAWVYLFNRAVTSLEVIPSGDYAQYCGKLPTG